MERETGQPTTIDEYLAQYLEDLRQTLRKIRAVIQESAPGAVEKINNGMPAYHLNGKLIYFVVN